MTARQPDVAGAILALDQAMIALAVAKSTLLGETGPVIDLAAAESDPANPYGSSKHGRFDAGSPAEVAEGTEFAAGTSVNPTTPGRDCAVPDDRELWFCHGCKEFHAPATPLALPAAVVPFPHLPHLPQRVGGNPMCSLCGLDHYALHAIETTGGA